MFSLTKEGMELIEVAPGIDIEKDILGCMNFIPIMKNKPRLMDERIFAPPAMGLLNDLTELLLEERLTYDADENLFFVNFEGHKIRNSKDIKDIEEMVTTICSPLREKGVHNCQLRPF